MPYDVVATFPDLPRAQRARTLLDEAGVESELGGDGVASSNPFGPVLNRGIVHLAVDEARVDEATRLLRQGGFGKAVDRAEKSASTSRQPTGPQHVRFAGLLVVAMSILLLLSRQDPVAWILIGFGVLLAGIGHVGMMKARRRAASPD